MYFPPLAGGGSRLYCVSPSGGGNSRPCLDIRPPCHPAVTFVGPVVGVALELVVVAALVVEGVLEADVVVGVAAAVKAVVVVLMLGVVGQQTRSPQGFLSSVQFIELQNSS